MRWQDAAKPGDVCSCCKRTTLHNVRSVLVCPVCDHVNEWPVHR